MNKYLIIIVGNNYLFPFEVTGSLDYIVRNLCNESFNNNYIYSIYVRSDRLGCYVPMGTIHHGFFDSKETKLIDGIRINR